MPSLVLAKITLILTLIYPASKWTNWAIHRHHFCLSRTAASASSQVSPVLQVFLDCTSTVCSSSTWLSLSLSLSLSGTSHYCIMLYIMYALDPQLIQSLFVSIDSWYFSSRLDRLWRLRPSFDSIEST